MEESELQLLLKSRRVRSETVAACQWLLPPVWPVPSLLRQPTGRYFIDNIVFYDLAGSEGRPLRRSHVTREVSRDHQWRTPVITALSKFLSWLWSLEALSSDQLFSMDMNIGSTRGEDGGSVRRATLAGNQLRSQRHAKSRTPAGGAMSRPQPDFIGIWLALALFMCAIQHINTPPHEEFVVSRLFVTFPASRWPITRMDSRQDQPSSNFVW